MVFKQLDKNNLIKMLSASLLIVASVYSAQSSAVILDATVSKDNTIYSNVHTSNALGAMFSGVNGNNGESRGLIKFDLTGIPAGATINSATLVIPVVNESNTNGPINSTHQWSLHRVNVDWGEGSSVIGGITQGSAGGGNGGIAATVGDVTWFESIFGAGGANTGTDWTDGGDFNATASATAARGVLSGMTWSSVALTQDIQDWVDGTNPHHGWLVQAVTKANSILIKFGSKDTTPASTNPTLQIDYTEAVVVPVPVPTFAWLLSALLIGLLGALKVRRNI